MLHLDFEVNSLSFLDNSQGTHLGWGDGATFSRGSKQSHLQLRHLEGERERKWKRRGL